MRIRRGFDLFLAAGLLLSLTTAAPALAQKDPNKEMTAEAMDVRNRLESEVQKNLHDLVSTQLDPKLFTIAVRAKVVPLSPPQPKENPQKEGLPPGMDLGAIDVRELLTSYDRQIEELKLRQEAKKESATKFQITALEVNVGLDESFSADYAKKFEAWLKTKMKSDYGAVVVAKMTRIKLKGAPSAPGDSSPEGQNNADFFPIIAAVILGLSVLGLGFWLKSGMTQIATAQKSLSVESRGGLEIEGAGAEELAEGEKLPEAVRPEVLDSAEFERLISKIAFVCLEINSKTNDLVRVWVDSGDAGFLKTALLIDTLVNARERIMTQTGALAPLRIPLDNELAVSREENLAEAYRTVASMSEFDKIQVLRQIYWDLVSVRTLGLQSLRRPFDFLQGMAKENIVEVLQAQKDEARALALIYLPAETQAVVLNEYEESTKVQLIRNMLEQSQISQKSIWDIDTSVKVASLSQVSQPEEKLVNLFPRTVEVLRSLSETDEIRILRQVTPQLPDSGVAVKNQYVSLAFIDEWKPEYVRKLAQVATADELLTLIRHIPEAQELILNECAPKVRVIVEDDLRVAGTRDRGPERAKLASLRGKWFRVVAAESIAMAKVFASRAKERGSHAA